MYQTVLQYNTMSFYSLLAILVWTGLFLLHQSMTTTITGGHVMIFMVAAQ